MRESKDGRVSQTDDLGRVFDLPTKAGVEVRILRGRAPFVTGLDVNRHVSFGA